VHGCIGEGWVVPCHVEQLPVSNECMCLCMGARVHECMGEWMQCALTARPTNVSVYLDASVVIAGEADCVHVEQFFVSE
jgi:hypothetical protein